METPEQIAAEEARARAYRQQFAQRVRYQTALWNALAGNPAARKALMARWEPVIGWLAERAMPPDDTDLDPLGISDTVNVGR